MANQSDNTTTPSPSAGGEGSGRRSSTADSSKSSDVHSRCPSVSSSKISSDTVKGPSGSGAKASSVAGSATSKDSKRSRHSVETITNYGNAVPGSSSAADRVSAPPSFAEFVRNNGDDNHRSSSERAAGDLIPEEEMVIEVQMERYKEIIQCYTELYNYVHGGRQAMLEEVNAAERSYGAVERSVLHFPLTERQAVNNMLASYAQKITEMKGRIEIFDNDIEPTHERIKESLTMALYNLPVDMLCRIVQESQWPNEYVCQDLSLPYDYLLMYRDTYELPKTNVISEGESNKSAENIAAARIRELEAMVQRLSRGLAKGGKVTPKQKEGEKLTTVLGDAKPEEKKIDYAERRKRTRFPKFSNGSASEAQQWMKHYEHLCDFVNFDDHDKVDELSVVLTDNALNWYLNVDKNDWSEVKKAFLLQFGGGDDPALVALAELKKLRQGKMSMKQFGPLISDLLDRAQIYRPGVQIDYFKERINGELLRAVIQWVKKLHQRNLIFRK